MFPKVHAAKSGRTIEPETTHIGQKAMNSALCEYQLQQREQTHVEDVDTANGLSCRIYKHV